MAPITGKICVITGSNRGIGLELTRQLAAKGNTIYATARNPSQAKELQKLAKDADVHVSALDVTDESSINSWAKELKNSVDHVDLLINNAGVLESTGLRNVTTKEMMNLFAINSIGPVLTTQALHKLGLLGRPGKSMIANLTSKMGSMDDNGMGGYYSYRMSKAALNAATVSMSRDLSPDVTCVLLHPGYVRTDMTGGSGLIDARTCASGLISVLESGKTLNGKWFDYTGKEIPW